MSVPPNDAIGRVREPMHICQKGNVISLPTSIGGPLDRFVRVLCVTLDIIHTSLAMI